MESKTILKEVFSEVKDKTHRELPLIALMKGNDNKCVENGSKSDSEIYLDLLSETFVLFNIKANDLSPIEESIVVCDKLKSITHKLQLKQTNESIDKSLIDLKSNIDSFEHKFNESVREMKSEQTFESVIGDKIQFYSSKFKEYYNSVKSKENTLSKIGFNSGLRDESIEDLKQSNEELRNRLIDINTRINEYKDFIPTESHLRNKINEMKLQINEYDNYFNKV